MTIEKWKRMAERFQWPNNGHWMIVPGEGRECQLLHGESKASIDIKLDKGETLKDLEDTFQKVFDKAEVKAPMFT